MQELLVGTALEGAEMLWAGYETKSKETMNLIIYAPNNEFTIQEFQSILQDAVIEVANKYKISSIKVGDFVCQLDMDTVLKKKIANCRLDRV